jgi:RHS repeat-associated protein
MALPGRVWNRDAYRYGFNGQEYDGELGDIWAAEFWEYDASIGRRWDVDPVFIPNLSPYVAFGCNPILYIDSDGDAYKLFVNVEKKTITVKMTFYTTQKDFDRAVKGKKYWEGQSRKFQYIVRGTKNGVKQDIAFDVVFEIDIKPNTTPEERDKAYKNDRTGFANAFQVSSESFGKEKMSAAKNRFGVTEGDEENCENLVTVANDVGYFDEKGKPTTKVGVDRETEAHEMGHAMGFNHWKSDQNSLDVIMVEAYNFNEEPVRKPSLDKKFRITPNMVRHLIEVTDSKFNITISPSKESDQTQGNLDSNGRPEINTDAEIEGDIENFEGDFYNGEVREVEVKK